MKVCSLCKNSYEDWVEFCFQDGQPLLAGAASPAGATSGSAPPPVSLPVAPPPAVSTVPSSVASAPSLDPGASADWDAFEAPEPTLIRMQRLAAQQGPGGAPAVLPKVMQPALGGLVAPAPPSRPGFGSGGAPSGVASGADTPDFAAPGLPRGGLGARPPSPVDAPESLPAPRAVPPPVHGITAVPLSELEAEPASTAEVLKAEARQAEEARGESGSLAPVVPLSRPAVAKSESKSESAGPESDGLGGDFFNEKPREDEDQKATVPMYAAQAEDREREVRPQPTRSSSGRPQPASKDRDDGGMAAPAAAGIGLAMIGAIGAGVLVLVLGGVLWMKMSADKADVVDTTPPPAEVKPPPKLEPAPPVEPPPVEPSPVEPSPVEPSPGAVTDPGEAGDDGSDAGLTANPSATSPTPGTATPGGAAPKPGAATTPGATTTPGTKPATTPATAGTAASSTAPKSGTTPPSGTGAASPWGTVTPSTAPAASTTSDNPWGTASQVSTGTLRITSDPTGATVFVDDKPYGTTPSSVDLPYGKHKVRLSLAGHRTESSDVNLNVASMSVPFRLTPEEITGIINVFGPTGASVWIDDHDMGPLPVSVQVREGVHGLKLIQADGKSCSSSRDVRFTSGGRPLAINLQPCG